MRDCTIRLQEGTIQEARPPNADGAPTADGGYPVDGDLEQMTDDGCPLTPDPARWADPDWRDETAAEPIGGRDSHVESGTFGAPVTNVPAAPANSHWQRLREQADVRERWRAACDRLVRRSGECVQSGSGGSTGESL